MVSLQWFLNHFEEVTSSTLIMIMAVFAFCNVLSRYVVNIALNFTEELNIYFFVWLAFLGSAWAARNGSHMAVSLIYDQLPRPIRRFFYIAIQIITTFFFFALGYCGWVEVQDEIALNAMTETLSVPVWWFTSAIPCGSFLIILRSWQKACEDLRSDRF